ncbi:M13 family metallopeptidase [Myxococcus xanthus]|uniref:Peptidase M13 n=1 Tax=Myxococcus xanthus TaxID=34 RepID=A0AAE6FZN4_MYXXA|nr:M13-type metalloendopeptidase [Myxococcus xanthus]QDE68231.1 peptidase M13 [Myxococcus xanthus]QDE75508.1 peptidase M13 [Myxococcus xanthus]QDE82811.1 peptidase M13 [Myxococcus xanthus]QDE97083.1 peptidase M13 [Myxococcus xanthus]
MSPLKTFSRRAWARSALGTLLLTGCATTQQPAPSDDAPPPAVPAAQAASTEAVRSLGVELKHLDRDVRPQDDFYTFVNGNWLKTTSIPADRARYGTIIELVDKAELAMRAIIEESATAKERHPGSTAQKVGDLYNSFMDTQHIESLGLKPVRDELERVKAVKRADALPELFATLLREGVPVPFGIFVGQDQKQATRYTVYATQLGLGLPDRDYYTKQEPRFVEVRAAYVAYIEKLLTLAGEKNAKKAAQDVMAFETALAAKQWDRARNRDREKTYNPKTVAELDALTPGFSWGRFLKASGAEATPSVIVRQPDYLEALGGLLKSTPLPVIKQYLALKVLDTRAPLLSSAFDQAHFEFRGKTLQGLEENRPRWKRGVAQVNEVVGEAVGQLYVERHFSPDSKKRMQELVANLREAFRKGIDGLDWMSPATKAQAQAKLEKFGVKIGYPDKWRDYSSLDIVAGDLVGNVRRGELFDHQRAVGKLGKPIDREEWGMTPQTVNAYYSSTMNEIVFPAAILQPPFFDPEADDATNYGAIGGVIGHEFSHGFDDQGSRSDGDGNLRDWWTPEDKTGFEQRTNMLVNQYNGFSPLEAMNVNGKLTLGENIGDLSGLTVAYQAYKLSTQGKTPPVIDGFSGDQRFFLGWGQIWRGLYRDDAMRQMLLTDPHSPPRYRVNGVVRNMPEFYEAFGVKEGDANWLPPEQRVKIW